MINKCPRKRFLGLVKFMLEYGEIRYRNQHVAVVKGITKQTYVIHLLDKEPIGYVFGNTLVVPEGD